MKAKIIMGILMTIGVVVSGLYLFILSAYLADPGQRPFGAFQCLASASVAFHWGGLIYTLVAVYSKSKRHFAPPVVLSILGVLLDFLSNSFLDYSVPVSQGLQGCLPLIPAIVFSVGLWVWSRESGSEPLTGS